MLLLCAIASSIAVGSATPIFVTVGLATLAAFTETFTGIPLTK